MENRIEERMEGVISVSTDIWGDSVITSNNVEVLDKQKFINMRVHSHLL